MTLTKRGLLSQDIFKIGCAYVSVCYLKKIYRFIFDHSDFHDFYAIKSLTVSDFGVKIKVCLKNI